MGLTQWRSLEGFAPRNRQKPKRPRQIEIHVGLDLAAERIAAAELRLLLSDPSAADLPEAQLLPPVQVATIGHPDGELVNIPAVQGVEKPSRYG